MIKSITISFLLLCSSCGIYSFSGSSIPSEAKSISIDYFENNALTKQPILSQIISEKLKDFFVQRTNLQLENQDGDLHFSGEITKYEIKPMSINSNETAGQNRLTISIKVKYSNRFQSENNFDQTFSRYKDFDSNLNLNVIEEELIDEISKQLIDDVFNKSVVNW
ncbi:MAG: LptE family protein [Flavobacteriales bacterium]|jgi:hypothetical protein|tara:strand:+ start:173 stop:667 length:495 start_codon:yes stop_codon:yes gene_type:complete